MNGILSLHFQNLKDYLQRDRESRAKLSTNFVFEETRCNYEYYFPKNNFLEIQNKFKANTENQIDKNEKYRQRNRHIT